jgi:hypothetical protein
MRSTVGASNRSRRARIEPPVIRRRMTPCMRRAAPGAFCSVNATWKIGAWPRLRCGASSSTIFSNGTSWCWNASSVVRRTWARDSRNVGAPAKSVRSTSMLTKKPISPSSSGRLRPAIGEPTTTVCWPL